MEERTYVIYNEGTDVDYLVTQNKAEALDIAGRLIDGGAENDYVVFIYDCTPDEYPSIKSDPEQVWTVAGFIKNEGLFNGSDLDYLQNEALHHLDENEQIQALHFIPDAMLIAEIDRRCKQYRIFADRVREASEGMMIYV